MDLIGLRYSLDSKVFKTPQVIIVWSQGWDPTVFISFLY